MRVNLVKLYNEAAQAARDKTGVVSPEDAEYFALIDEYADWRKNKKSKKKRKSSGSDSDDYSDGTSSTKQKHTAPPRTEDFFEPDSSSEETDINDLSLEDRVRRIPYPKRSHLDVSRQGATGTLTPLGRAKMYAMWKLSASDERKRYDKCDRYYETLHDNFVSKLDGLFRQTFNNIFQEPDLLERYELCRGFQKTNFVFDLFASRIYRHSEAEVRRSEDEFYRMSQFNNQSGSEFVNAIELKRDVLRRMGINITNQQLKTRILMSLNETYENYFRFYLPHKINLEQLKADIRQADLKLFRKRKKPSANAQVSKNRRLQDNAGNRSFPKPTRPTTSTPKPVGTVEKPIESRRVKCFNCKQYGHISRDCKKPKQRDLSSKPKRTNAKPVASISLDQPEEVNEDEVDLHDAEDQGQVDHGFHSDGTVEL